MSMRLGRYNLQTMMELGHNKPKMMIQLGHRDLQIMIEPGQDNPLIKKKRKLDYGHIGTLGS
ncbi:hypothetical protein PPACK8108_LOCUS19450 [Phakopsora pachyrhizi]|uniref:Integrase n=1 Tax=Phakopsora pachyrhizi TaxID=170000 RepID=A0AAV0BDV4_PHAPC|nr:hypothetical protein PPACK8108_LOCUS19450 [Phakopsora pachyrhizi]